MMTQNRRPMLIFIYFVKSSLEGTVEIGAITGTGFATTAATGTTAFVTNVLAITCACRFLGTFVPKTNERIALPSVFHAWIARPTAAITARIDNPAVTIEVANPV